MTTWKDYEKIKALQHSCDTWGFIVKSNAYGDFCISADNKIHPTFTENNTLYITENVDSAIAWIQGVLTGVGMWGKELEKGWKKK